MMYLQIQQKLLASLQVVLKELKESILLAQNFADVNDFFETFLKLIFGKCKLSNDQRCEDQQVVSVNNVSWKSRKFMLNETASVVQTELTLRKDLIIIQNISMYAVSLL